MKDTTTIPSRIDDKSVDHVLDQEIRTLLQTCFPKEERFRTQRYYNESPAMRWVLRDDDQLIGHIATHHKSLRSGEVTSRFCGISEVCIMPEYRGQGRLAPLLQAVKNHAIQQSYEFLLLLGATKVYEHFGYQPARNIYFKSQSPEPSEFAMYKRIGEVPWPKAPIEIEGPYF